MGAQITASQYTLIYLGTSSLATILPGTNIVVPVSNAASFVANSWVDIDSGAKLESALITAVNTTSNTITLARVAISHAKGAQIVVGTLTGSPTNGTGQPGLLQVTNTANFEPGFRVVIDSGNLTEAATVTSVNAASGEIGVSSLRYSHQPGAPVLETAVGSSLIAPAPEAAEPNFVMVRSTNGFYAGVTAVIGNGSSQEAIPVLGIPQPYTLELLTPPAASYAYGTPVVQQTPYTTITAGINKNTAGITVANAAFFKIGDGIQIGAGADQEYAFITFVNYQNNGITFQNVNGSYNAPGSTFAHLAGEPVFPLVRNDFDVMGAEIDCQSINASIDAPDASNTANFQTPKYLPGVDDVYPFSGTAAEGNPIQTSWLKLTPLSASQQDSLGGTLCTASWVTPSISSDYYVDVIAYNNAAFPVPYNVSASVPSAAFYGDSVNWRDYDNVWGFTTQPFVAQNSILVVNDYALPQKFFESKFAGSNLPTTFYGAESYITEMDANENDKTPGSGKLPQLGIEENFGNGTLSNLLPIESPVLTNNPAYQNGLGYDSYIDDEQGDYSGANLEPKSQAYDIWRILSRGPVPSTVLSAYTPRVVTQPANPLVANSKPTTVVNAPACVLWVSPFAGDEFVGSGTITDVSTQTLLDNFLSAGGRLMVEGIDVGWALTNNGAVTNNFYTNDLQAVFGTDSVGYNVGDMILADGGAQTDYISHDAFINQGQGGDPFANDGVGHRGFIQYQQSGTGDGILFSYQTPNNNKTTIANLGFNTDYNDSRTDGSLNASDAVLGFIDGFFGKSEDKPGF